MRVYVGANFLVKMIFEVIEDLRHLRVIYTVFLLLFAIEFAILFQHKKLEVYSGLSLVSYLAMSFRTSLGDFADIENFQDLRPELILFTWFVYFFAV